MYEFWLYENEMNDSYRALSWRDNLSGYRSTDDITSADIRRKKNCFIAFKCGSIHQVESVCFYVLVS